MSDLIRFFGPVVLIGVLAWAAERWWYIPHDWTFGFMMCVHVGALYVYDRTPYDDDL